MTLLSAERCRPESVEVLLVGVAAVALDQLGDLVVRRVVRDVQGGVACRVKCFCQCHVQFSLQLCPVSGGLA